MKLLLCLFLFFININLNAADRQYIKIEQDLLQKINDAKESLPSCNGWVYVDSGWNQWIGNNLWYNRGTEEVDRIRGTARKIDADLRKHPQSKNPERYFLELSAKLKEKHPNFFANYDNEKERVKQKIHKECYGVFYSDKKIFNKSNGQYEFVEKNFSSLPFRYEGLFVDNELIIGSVWHNERALYTGEWKNFGSHGWGFWGDKIKTVALSRNGFFEGRVYKIFENNTYSFTEYTANLPTGKSTFIDTRKEIIEYPSEYLLIKGITANKIFTKYYKVGSEINKKWGKKHFNSVMNKNYSIYDQEDFKRELEEFYTEREALISYLLAKKNNVVVENKIIDTLILIKSAEGEWATRESISQSEATKEAIIFLRHLINSYPSNHPYYLFASMLGTSIPAHYPDDIIFFTGKTVKNIDQLSLIFNDSLWYGDSNYCEMRHHHTLDYFTILNILYNSSNDYDKYKQTKIDLLYKDILPTVHCSDNQKESYGRIAKYFAQLNNHQEAVNFYYAARKYGNLSNSDIEYYGSSLEALGKKKEANKIYKQAIEETETGRIFNFSEKIEKNNKPEVKKIIISSPSPKGDNTEYLSKQIDEIINWGIVKYMPLSSLAYYYKNQSLDLAIFLQKIAVFEAYKYYINMTEEEPATAGWATEFFGQYFRELNSLLIQSNRFVEADEILYVIKSKEIADFTSRSINYLTNEYIPELNSIEKLLFDDYLGLSSTTKFIDFRDVDKDDAAKFTEEFNQFLAKANKIFMKTRGSGIKLQDNINNNKMTPIKSLDRLKKIQVKLLESNKNSSIIRYYVDKEFINIIVTTATKQKHFHKKINKQKLSTLIQKYRFSIINFKDDYKNKSSELYQILFRDVDLFLQNENVEQVYLSLDQELRYLPFSSLLDGNKFIVEKYNISIYPETSNTNFFSSNKTIEYFAALGLTKSLSGFDALPNVKKEINNIYSILRDKSKSEIFIDDKFTKENFWGVINRDFPIIHISTHFNLSPTNIKKSFLLLGDGNKLNVSDLYKLVDESTFHDIILLSACNTAKGANSGENGAEIDTLADIFLRSGSNTVIASLWNIADVSTPSFMKSFYNKIAHSSTRTSALAFSKNEMIKSEKFNHPFFWSSFILIGNPF